MTQDLDRAIAPWLHKAATLVARRLADARSHAESGNPAAAAERLQELRTELIRHVEAARLAFYQTAATNSGLAFDVEAESIAKGHPILGQSPADITRDIETTARGLAMATNTARAVPPDTRAAIFGAWEASQRNLLLQRVRVHLSDAQVSLHNVIQTIAAEEADQRQGQEQGLIQG